MKLEKFLEKVADKTDIRLNGVYPNGEKSYYIEFEYWSDLGEDVVISLVVNKLTKDEIIHAMYVYKEDFDADEHATMWASMNGEHGAPRSVRALIDDAEEQKEKFEEIYCAMTELA